MIKETVLQHVALQYTDKKQADIFFIKILGLQPIKSFDLSEELSEQIFGIKEIAKIQVYANDKAYFEIFITKKPVDHGFEHVCIKIGNKEEFIENCKKHGIKPFFVKKGEKTLLFVKDFSNNLFEIK
jgi:hypothetical protein